MSYARDDAPAAQRIAEALRTHGVEVWFDLSELRGGDAWDQKIRKQIKACTLFLPIISAKTQERSEGYFRLEWRLAVERTHLMAEGVPFIAPIAVDETLEADAVVPSEFMRVQWTHLPGALPTPAFIGQIRQILSQPRKASASGAAPAQPSQPAAKSVAVLAFVNLSQDPENEFFSDGISEELLNLVARIPGLRVAARTSAFYFKGRNAPMSEIARTLGVAHIVEGSVRKSGNRVRISAKLINAADGFQAWSETFDRELKDIFALQDEIAGIIAQNLQLKLGQSSRSAMEVDPEAHRLVLEGRHYWSLRSPPGFEKAEECMRKAIKLSPEFAPAHAGLADVFAIRSIFMGLKTGEISTGDMLVAKAESELALGLDPALGEAHGALAMYYFFSRDFPAAERHFKEMLTLNPNYAYGHLWHAHMLLARGMIDAGLRAAERAIALDPLSFPARGFQAQVLYMLKRYGESMAANDRGAAIRETPFLGFNGTCSLCLIALGRREEALIFARKLLADESEASRGWPTEEAILCLQQSGEFAEAEAAASRARAALPANSCFHGTILSILGRFDEALPYLESTPAWLQSRFFYHPLWDPHREDPRFLGLVAKLGVEREYKVGRETLARMQAMGQSAG